MRHDRPSSTAQATLYARHLGHLLGDLDDAAAQALLDPPARLRAAAVRLGLRFAPKVAERYARGPGVATQVARTRHFDEVVLGALDDGVRQVVILGAGYDTRATRLARVGVRFIEVDHPATQQHKLRRLALAGGRGGASYCAIDLLTDDLVDGLTSLGIDGAPTLVLCEGVLRYLGHAGAAGLLRSLTELPVADLRLAANVPLRVRSTGPTGPAAVVSTWSRRAVERRAAERSLLELDEGSIHELFEGAGWDAVDVRSDVALWHDHLAGTGFPRPGQASFAYVRAERPLRR